MSDRPQTSPVAALSAIRVNGSEARDDTVSPREDSPGNHLWVLFLATIFLLVLLFHLSVLSSPIALLGKEVPVDFTRTRQPSIPPPEASPHQLRVGIGTIFSSPATTGLFPRILENLTAHLGNSASISLSMRLTPTQLLEALSRTDLDLALAGAGIIAHLPASHGYELLVTPVINGSTTFPTFLIVPASSSANCFLDLKGKIFAFSDPFSYAGYAYPCRLIRQAGFRPEVFFRRTLFSQSPENSFFLLKKGLTDAACIEGPMYSHLRREFPQIARQFRVIEEWPSMPLPAILVSKAMAPGFRQALREALLNVGEGHAGKQLLEGFFIDRFVPADSSAYESIRQTMQAGNNVQVEP